ncbi:MAG: serine hydrolase [Eubacteriales bacterium]|nr:serine hydrolase [Eubacteriales bacterium]
MYKRKNIISAFIVFLFMVVLSGSVLVNSGGNKDLHCLAGKTEYQPLLYQEDTTRFYRVWKAYYDAVEGLNGLDYSFYVYDIESGWELGFDENKRYYSASAIKAPYIISVIEQDPSVIEKSRQAVAATISVSDNNSYRYLRTLYGDEVFESWLRDSGCDDVEKEYNYAYVTAKEMGMMWKEIYDFLETGGDGTGYCKELLANVWHSFLLEEIGDEYTVYSKAGWIGGNLYQAENDAGVILCPEHPYVMAVMSTAYTRTEELGKLANALNEIHDLMFGE